MGRKDKDKLQAILIDRPELGDMKNEQGEPILKQELDILLLSSKEKEVRGRITAMQAQKRAELKERLRQHVKDGTINTPLVDGGTGTAFSEAIKDCNYKDSHNYIDIIRLLIRLGADANTVDNGKPVLLLTIMLKRFDIIELLRKKKADVVDAVQLPKGEYATFFATLGHIEFLSDIWGSVEPKVVTEIIRVVHELFEQQNDEMTLLKVKKVLAEVSSL